MQGAKDLGLALDPSAPEQRRALFRVARAAIQAAEVDCEHERGIYVEDERLRSIPVVQPIEPKMQSAQLSPQSAAVTEQLATPRLPDWEACIKEFFADRLSIGSSAKVSHEQVFRDFRALCPGVPYWAFRKVTLKPSPTISATNQTNEPAPLDLLIRANPSRLASERESLAGLNGRISYKDPTTLAAGFCFRRVYGRTALRILTVVDDYSRECVGLVADTSLPRQGWFLLPGSKTKIRFGPTPASAIRRLLKGPYNRASNLCRGIAR